MTTARILHGDCLDVLKTLPDNSVDAVVTDPPYGLAFMGKNWDYDVPSEDIWRECLRVLKPGGHLLAFAGTRTQHRMAVRIEDAGFEIRDMIAWVYGCLSADTELLVDGEWVPYHRATQGSLTLCYDKDHDTLQWLPIEETYVYPYADTAYRLHSADTDQLVSRNHRVIVERSDRREFVLAEQAAREQAVRVPVLESLPGLPPLVPLRDEGAGQPQPDLLALLRRGGHPWPSTAGGEAAERAEDGAGAVRGVRGVDVEAGGVGAAGQDADLLQNLQREAAGGGLGDSRAQGAGGVVPGSGGTLAEADDRRGKPRLEGRRDDPPQEGELRGAGLHALPGSIQADGPHGRVRDAAPAGRGAAPGALPTQDGSGASHQPQPSGQSAREPDAVRLKLGAQAVRSEGHTHTTLATITPEWYEGVVWCVRVPTGAFVARRNGKIFVTGNSGFPKSLDVSKAIDKAAGAQRKVTGQRDTAKGRGDGKRGYDSTDMLNAGSRERIVPITAPATPEAQQWEGWGTALKPALEPVTVARKPLAGTVAHNVTLHGTGALNIDGCRIVSSTGQLPSEETWEHAQPLCSSCAEAAERPPKLAVPAIRASTATSSAAPILSGKGERNPPATDRTGTGCSDGTRAENSSTNLNTVESGRMLTAPSLTATTFTTSTETRATTDWRTCSACGGTITPRSTASTSPESRNSRPGENKPGSTASAGRWPSNLIHDGSEEVTALFPDSDGGAFPARRTPNAIYGGGKGTSLEQAGGTRAMGDTGSAARFFYCAKASRRDRGEGNDHPTVKPTDLMRYLCRLVTPPGGVVLDPFCGSGSTGKAALLEGFNFIGIEREEAYVTIARARLNAMQPALLGAS